MKLKQFVFLLTLLTSFYSYSSQVSEFDKVHNVLMNYLNGTSQGKPDLIKKAFLPSLEIQWLNEEGVFNRRKGVDYISMFKENEKKSRVGRVVNIDITDTAASAKIMFEWNGKIYTDYILLLKINEEWKMANKIATWKQK